MDCRDAYVRFLHREFCIKYRFWGPFPIDTASVDLNGARTWAFRCPRIFQQSEGRLSNNTVRTILKKKNTKLYLYLTPYTKINARWSHDRNGKEGREGRMAGGKEEQRGGGTERKEKNKS